MASVVFLSPTVGFLKLWISLHSSFEEPNNENSVNDNVYVFVEFVVIDVVEVEVFEIVVIGITLGVLKDINEIVGLF